jgi:replicative superfamily II helicase
MPCSFNAAQQEAAMRVEDKGLKAVLPCGVGFHNASLSSADRSAVEQLFMAGDLLVLDGC